MSVRGGLRSLALMALASVMAVGIASGQLGGSGVGENPKRPAAPRLLRENDLVKDTPLLASLNLDAWRFHPGDDATWSQPEFDDSQWVLLSGNKSWDVQGYKGLSGFAWYRIHVQVPPGMPLEFSPGHVFDNFDVFVNGRKLATWGKPVAGAMPWYGQSAWSLLVPIPAEDIPESGDLVIALRVYHWPAWAAFHVGGFGGTWKLLGSPAAVEQRADLEKSSDLVRWLPRLLIDLIILLAGSLAMLLYLRERNSSEYLWFGIYQLSLALSDYWIFATRHWFPVLNGFRDGGSELLSSIAAISLLIFLFRFIGKPIDRWTRWLLLAQIPVVALDVYINWSYALSAAFDSAMMGLDAALLNGTILWMLFRNWRGSRAARRLALPMVVISCVTLYQFEKQFQYTASITPGYATFLFEHPFQLGWEHAAQIFFLAAMAFVLTERFAETQREKSRLAGEFEAARTIQQVLIPDFLPEVPGLKVESAYLPAQEVGGDFFQVLPLKDGAAFVVLGDVSGKGLKAAMTVSLIVGTLRTYAEFYTSPAELLAGLNRRLVGRGDGFTTCLALLVEKSGDVTIANAGHPNPYLAGTEIETEPSIPLGLTTDVEYAETKLHLAPHQTLTLVTDGVVEAAHAGTRELFGFTRTASISTHSAQSIADEAQYFGHPAPQADDITVLTLTRTVTA
jgi:phosphoserine phosphatase RsbU/P